MPAETFRICVAALTAATLLVACGGGGPTETTVASGSLPQVSAVADTSSAAPAAEPARAVRIAAATATAGSDGNDCASIRPFYWELGDAEGLRAAASVTPATASQIVTADSELRLASATKWLYAAYVAQRRGGELSALDRSMLTLRAGYVDFSGCRDDQTVDECLTWQANDRFSPDADGRFYYGGGHLQKHASLLGLGALDAAGLAAEMRSVLGPDLAIGMAQSRPGGGATATAAAYARFLRKLLGGELALGALLGSAPACASVSGCPPGEALYAPAPAGETWHYSLGHWVEDDPAHGDGAFSTAGAHGFYAWIAGSRGHYGVVARDVAATGDAGAGVRSARCGRLIRQAWNTGVAR